jgi:uncharacterized membrane protein
MIYFIFPIRDYSTLVNSIGIILEIVGFVLILVTVRPIPRTTDSRLIIPTTMIAASRSLKQTYLRLH